MTAPTDLRATLRDAAKLLRDPVLRCDPGVARAVADHIDKIIADAPPTVAELLPMVDATHRVRWLTAGDYHEAWCDDRGTIGFSILDANDRHAQFTDLNVDDLDRPARLVEVSP